LKKKDGVATHCAGAGLLPGALLWSPAFHAKPWKMRLVFCRPLRYLIAMATESIENIARKLAEVVPEGLKSVREDLEGNFRSVLQTSLAKLDLVTREEFEVQEAVLAKTRSKLEALEARLKEIEKE
jgi:BMFP domain-containing protein YqiC